MIADGCLANVAYPCIGGPLDGQVYAAPVSCSEFSVAELPGRPTGTLLDIPADELVAARIGVYQLWYSRVGLAWLFQT